MTRIVSAIWCLCWLLVPRGWSQPAAPQIQWQRTYGGTLNDILHCLQQTSDGGYILGGRSIADPGGTKTAPSYGNYDYWIARLDANGRQLWDRSYGGHMYDALRSLRQTADGGFILAGYTESPPDGNKTAPYLGPRSFWVIRTDANGNKIWERTYGGTGGETLAVMRQTPDGGYILAGTSNSSASGNKTSPNYGWGSRDFWLMRINANGDIMWDRAFGSASDDDLHSLELTADGGFIVGGTSPVGVSGNKTSDNFGGPDYWIIRLDANGNKLWEQTYGGWGTDDLYAVVPTGDGGFLLGGYSDSPPSGVKTAQGFGGADLWVVRVDATGNRLWDRSYGGNGHDSFMDSFSMQRTSDGGFIMGTGTGGASANGNKTAPNYGGNDMWVVRIDAAGNKLWDQSFGASDTDALNAMQQTADGGFIFGGQSYSDVGGNKTAARQGGADYWVVKVGPTLPGGNTPPTLSAIPDQAIDENQMSGAIPFTVGDAETAAAALVVSARSSNPALLPDNRIQLGGSGANRTLTLTPLPDQSGSAQVQVTVADAQDLRTTNAFLFTVRPIDDPPVISDPGAIHPNLVSHWTLDESSGNDVIDVMGRNRGLLMNGPERVSGKLGSALRFNGQNNYVNIPDSDSLDLGSRLTISFWFKPSQLLNGSTGRKDLFKKFISYWVILNYPSNSGRLAFVLNSGAPVVNSTTSQWLPDQWYHVAATYDGAFMRLYINGTLESSIAANGAPAVTAFPVQIGGNSEQNIFFPGSIDDVRLYNAPLADAEIRDLAAVAVIPNDQPQVSSLSDQTIDQNSRLDLAFTVSDTETLAANLTVTATSSNPALLPPAGLLLGGSSAARTLSLSPLSNQSGQTTVTIAVEDAQGGRGNVSFVLGVVATNQVGTDTAYVTNAVTRTLRNDFSGLVGYKITIGSEPLRITALARFAYAGDKDTHLVKIVRASDGVDLAGASVTISMLGATAGQWKFVALASSVTLLAGESYYVLSEEKLGGDHFADLNTTIQTTAVAVQSSGVYASASPNYFIVGGPSQTYGPPNFRYQKGGGGGAPVPTAAFQEPANDMDFILPTNVTLTVVVSSGVTNVDFFRDNVKLGSDTHSPARLVWTNPPPGNYVLTAKATDTNGGVALASAVNITVRTNGGGGNKGGQAFVVDKVLGELRNDFSGFVGMKITVGAQPLTVNALGRIVGPGNSGTHLVKFVRAADLVDLPNGAVSVATAGGTVGEFKYEPLGASVTLQANTMYYLVSQEVSGGDRWHGVLGTALTTLNVAMVNSGVFMGNGYGWSLAGTSQHAYGPVDFKLENSAPVPLAAPSEFPTAAFAWEPAPLEATLTTSMIHGHILVKIQGEAGQHYILEASNDLKAWIPVAEDTLERDEVTIVDVNAHKHQFRFYRAVLWRQR